MTRTRRRILPPFCALDRYVLSEFFRFYFLALIGFVGFIHLFDAFEKIDTFIDHNASLLQVARYYLYATPYNALLIAPIAALLATFLTVGGMTRFREIITIQAAGISVYRIFAPLYILGMLFSLGSFGFGEFVMPEANRRAREIIDGEIKGRTLRNLGSRTNVTYLGQHNRLYLIRRYDIPRQSMIDPTLQEFEGERLKRRVDARKAVFSETGWAFTDGVERRFGGDREEAIPFDSLFVELPEVPADFAREEVRPDEMSYPELARYTERVRQSGSSAEVYETDLRLRTAFPFATMVVILIASALAVQIRRGGIAIGFGFTLLITFVYWCGIRAGQVLGHSGTLPPLVAAWIVNIIFLVFGVVLLVRSPK